MSGKLRACVRLYRPAHGIKSVLAFLPLLCRGGVPDARELSGAAWAFLACWAAASGIYAMNDLLDAEADRKHPAKKYRPVAAGLVSPRLAAALAAGAWALAFAAMGLSGAPPAAMLVLAAYIAANALYALGLKRVAVVEAGIVASGFLARVYCGSLASGVPVSQWLYLCVTMGACYMILDKRRGELLRAGRDPAASRAVLASYTERMLSDAMSACRTSALVFYALWATSQDVHAGPFVRYLPATVPLLMLVLFRYDAAMSARDGDSDMVSAALADRWLAGSAAAFVLAVAAAIWTV